MFNFNSTLVRLKVFPYGSAVFCVIYFNSTLVRLKAISLKAAFPERRYFNSTLVRLKVCFDLTPPLLPSDFNSTLVRLKERSFATYGFSVAFQFHIGAIKSVIIAVKKTTSDRFQFHIGAIKSPRCKPHVGSLLLISIPHWCD